MHRTNEVSEQKGWVKMHIVEKNHTNCFLWRHQMSRRNS